MTDYKKIFKSVLNEEIAPEGGMGWERNPDDANISTDLPPHLAGQFNVPSDITQGDVGMQDRNMDRDVEQLNSLIQNLRGISKELQSMSEGITALNRSFKGIASVSQDLAKAFAAVETVSTNLSVYSIELPAQQEREKKSAEKQQKQAQM